MFSSKKMKEHMKSEISDIFKLKQVVKKGIWFLRNPFYVYVG